MENEVTSKNFIEMIIDKDLSEDIMTMFRQDFHRNQTDIFILDMQNLFY